MLRFTLLRFILLNGREGGKKGGTIGEKEERKRAVCIGGGGGESKGGRKKASRKSRLKRRTKDAREEGSEGGSFSLRFTFLRFILLSFSWLSFSLIRFPSLLSFSSLRSSLISGYLDGWEGGGVKVRAEVGKAWMKGAREIRWEDEMEKK